MDVFRRMAKISLIVLASLAVLLVATALILRPDRAIGVGVGMTAHTLCDDIFITGVDPERAFREDIASQGLGVRFLLHRMHVHVDAQARDVAVDWAGHFNTVARYQLGRGCTLGPMVAAVALSAPASTNDSAAIVHGSPALQDALAHAFTEPLEPPYRRVRAIVVMHDGQIIAERYAPGITPNSPLLAYSVSKSVINALVGILVREGKLNVTARAPVTNWDRTDDPRRAITLDQLLRMTSGLDLTESDTGLDPVSRMLFLEPDMAAFAERAKLKVMPGTQFEYSSGNTLIVSAIVRDTIGSGPDQLLAFAHRELFDPLGMQHVTLEMDQAGTPIGSTRFFASARDWARFGQLYLDDGVVNGRRILPSGWVAYSKRPTLDSDYGAGFWVNTGKAEDAHERVAAGMPADAFYASGNFGQRIVVIPSKRLVIVRFGVTADPPNFDIRGLLRLVNEVIAATSAPSMPKP